MSSHTFVSQASLALPRGASQSRWELRETPWNASGSTRIFANRWDAHFMNSDDSDDHIMNIEFLKYHLDNIHISDISFRFDDWCLMLQSKSFNTPKTSLESLDTLWKLWTYHNHMWSSIFHRKGMYTYDMLSQHQMQKDGDWTSTVHVQPSGRWVWAKQRLERSWARNSDILSQKSFLCLWEGIAWWKWTTLVDPIWT